MVIPIHRKKLSHRRQNHFPMITDSKEQTKELNNVENSKYWTVSLNGNTGGLAPIPQADAKNTYWPWHLSYPCKHRGLCYPKSLCFITPQYSFRTVAYGFNPLVAKQSCHFLDPQEDVTKLWFFVVFFFLSHTHIPVICPISDLSPVVHTSGAALWAVKITSW